MDLWTVALWVGKLGFAAFFVMSGINHLTNTTALTAYAQSKKLPFARAAVVVSGLMMLAGRGPLLFSRPPAGAAPRPAAVPPPPPVSGHHLSALTHTLFYPPH